MTEEVKEFVPDRPLTPQLVDNIMQALENSEQAAYMVYLRLATRFGAGQKI